MKSVLTQHRTKQKRAKAQKFFLRFGIFFVFVTGGSLFLLLSPWIQFNHVSLSGNTSVLSEDIIQSANNVLSERVAWFFPRRNILLFRPHMLETRLVKEFPRLATVEVTRSFSRSITLRVTERSGWGMYCKTDSSDCFYIAEDGILIAEAPQLTGNAVFRIMDKRPRAAFFILGEQAVEASDTMFFQKIIEVLQNKYAVSAREIILGRVFEGQTELITNEGWYVLFDKHTNKEEALENLILVLDQRITDRSLLEYIDIRFEGKVFYKNK